MGTIWNLVLTRRDSIDMSKEHPEVSLQCQEGSGREEVDGTEGCEGVGEREEIKRQTMSYIKQTIKVKGRVDLTFEVSPSLKTDKTNDNIHYVVMDRYHPYHNYKQITYLLGWFP